MTSKIGSSPGVNKSCGDSCPDCKVPLNTIQRRRHPEGSWLGARIEHEVKCTALAFEDQTRQPLCSRIGPVAALRAAELVAAHQHRYAALDQRGQREIPDLTLAHRFDFNIVRLAFNAVVLVASVTFSSPFASLCLWR